MTVVEACASQRPGISGPDWGCRPAGAQGRCTAIRLADGPMRNDRRPRSSPRPANDPRSKRKTGQQVPFGAVGPGSKNSRHTSNAPASGASRTIFSPDPMSRGVRLRQRRVHPHMRSKPGRHRRLLRRTSAISGGTGRMTGNCGLTTTPAGCLHNQGLPRASNLGRPRNRPDRGT